MGSRDDRNMCQRADDVPSYKFHPGSLGDRMRMSFASGATLYRGSASVGPGFGRSDRKVACCEKCSAALVALKKQALSLAVHHHFSCKETSNLSAFLHDNLRVHSHPKTDCSEREREMGLCGVCGTNRNQLKHEAIHLALNRSHSLAKPSFEASLSAGAALGHSEKNHGERVSREAVHQPRSQSHSPRTLQSPRTPQRSTQTLRRRGAKLPNLDMECWVEGQQQLVASKFVAGTDGVTPNSYHKAADGATRSCSDAKSLQTSSKIPHISRVVTIANTAAMSLLAKAAEKLNLTLRKKGLTSDPAPSNLSTCFREIIQNNPPPVPSCLLQAAARSKDSPNVAKIKVVLKVSESQGQPAVLQIDPSKKRVTIMDPIATNLPYTTMTLGRERKSPVKTFTFDAAYSQESGQTEMCAGILADVIRCVLSGSDGCVLGLGCANVGSWSSMVGSGENIQKLGLIPFAISWLYGAVERRRERTWTDLTVSVSAVELCCGEEDTLRDLLGEVGPSLGGIQDNLRAPVRVQEDPVDGMQIRSHNRVKAPTAERAASLLDVAISARQHTNFVTYLCHSSIMFFTFYVQPPRTESCTIGKGSRGITKLTMIDVCGGMRGVSKNKPPHAELGAIVLSLLSGHKTVPSKASKLSTLLRESLSHTNCHIAVIGQVDDSLAHLQESFSTIQLASRIRRTQKRTKHSTSCSPRGRSLTREKKGPQSLSLRSFHSTEEVDLESHSFHLHSRLDCSSSDQSCDTIIQINSDGSVHSKAAPMLTQPEFVPIIPSLHPNKADLEDPEFTALLEELLKIPQLHGEKKTEETVQVDTEVLKTKRKQPERDCLKCDTFAELQERLGCIDGSEMTMDVLKSSLKGLSLSFKPQPPKEVSQTLVNMGMGCCQSSFGEKQTNGALPGDSFQREDSGLFDCEECSANSSIEELLNQTLGMACCTELPNARPVRSGNHFCSKEDSKDKNANSSALLPSEKHESHKSAELFKADKRASPVGKSSTLSPSSSCSSSQSLAKSVIIGDVFPSGTSKINEDNKEMKATITVTVQQPLDQMGQDELVFSVVEEVTFGGEYDRGRTGGNIICIRDPAHSQTRDQSSTCSQPIKIISNVIDDSSAAGSAIVQPTGTESKKPHYHLLREKGFLPSFINPMLINLNVDSDLDGAKEKESPQETFQDFKIQPESGKNTVKYPEGKNNIDKENIAFSSEAHSVKTSDTVCGQSSIENDILTNRGFNKKTEENQMCERKTENTDKSHPRQSKHVCSTNNQRVSGGGGTAFRHVGNTHQRTGVSPGCQETISASSKTSSLPRGWQNPSHPNNHSREVTSSTSCSPGETLERRHGRQKSATKHNHHTSSSSKHAAKCKQDSNSSFRKAAGSFFTSSLTGKLVSSSSWLKSPADNSSKLFSTKLEQLASRTNSLGRTPRDFPTLERGNNSNFKSSYEENCEADCTFPRANRSPKRNPYIEQTHHFFHSENPLAQYAKNTHSKLSTTGKCKMGSPRVHRGSASSIKNHSGSHKSPAVMQSSSNAVLSPDCKAVSFEQSSSHFSSSPPRSYHSISWTPSQSSTCSSTKSSIQGFVNGRVSDSTYAGLDLMAPLPSPYSQVTAPRTPDDMNGHASDTTSVLSGDLPPAMGKTSLHFSNRSSLVSSGYDSMLRHSEATGSSTSNRESISDRSGSPLQGARSSRSSRRRGKAGTHQQSLSHDPPLSMKCTASSSRSCWMDRGTQEPYEIKVYEIDSLQRMQKRAGAGKQELDIFLCSGLKVHIQNKMILNL